MPIDPHTYRKNLELGFQREYAIEEFISLAATNLAGVAAMTAILLPALKVPALVVGMLSLVVTLRASYDLMRVSGCIVPQPRFLSEAERHFPHMIDSLKLKTHNHAKLQTQLFGMAAVSAACLMGVGSSETKTDAVLVFCLSVICVMHYRGIAANFRSQGPSEERNMHLRFHR